MKQFDQVSSIELIQTNERKKEYDYLAPKYYISKIVDYTKKFGLGYILNNGLIGVYFNDGTKMI